MKTKLTATNQVFAALVVIVSVAVIIFILLLSNTERRVEQESEITTIPESPVIKRDQQQNSQVSDILSAKSDVDFWNIVYYEELPTNVSREPRNKQLLLNNGKSINIHRNSVVLNLDNDQIALDFQAPHVDEAKIELNPSKTAFSVRPSNKAGERIFVYRVSDGNFLGDFPYADFPEIFARDYWDYYWIDDNNIAKISIMDAKEFFELSDTHNIFVGEIMPGTSRSQAQSFYTISITNCTTGEVANHGFPIPIGSGVVPNHVLETAGWISMSLHSAGEPIEFWLNLAPPS